MAMYRTVKISVWWDIEKCPVSKGLNANAIARNISSALVCLNYQGPLSISAYADTNRIPIPIQKALSSTAISLNQVPAGAEDAGEKKILVDMLFWAIDNPAPANFLIISGANSFSNALHQLSMRRYNILLAHPPQVSSSLVGPATVIWLWPTLSAGGAPYFIASSVTDQLSESIHSKTKLKHATNLSRLPPLQVPPQQSMNNDVVKPPLVKSLVIAPHEFFSSAIPTPNLPKSNQDSQSQVVNTASTVPEETRDLDCTSRTSHSSTSCYDEREMLIDVILRALNALKVEMVLSTERNITDCILYGNPRYQAFDIRKALDFAIEHQRVAKRILGALHLYVPRNETLWKCVNHINAHPNDFPQAKWDRIKQFLTSASGRSSILASQCRYEASLILRESCLGELPLGGVLKIMHMIITAKEWIKVHHSGWQPITITLMETRDNKDSTTFLC